MDKIIILIIALLLIGFIMWWFFSKRKTDAIEAKIKNNTQEVEIVVSGGYTPNIVVLQKDIPAKIIFNRKDTSNCFNEVVFPDFGIKEQLPINEAFPIEIDTKNAGEYQYSCGMNMFHGKIIIK
ncbi:MAG: hypothetical protein QG614_36 [Patescibacteria group bacterium]|nr:hypothetical protein [Patescibacteria group bacterium]